MLDVNDGKWGNSRLGSEIYNNASLQPKNVPGVKEKQKLYDIVNFSQIHGIEDTDDLLSIFIQVENQVERENSSCDFISILLREWKRQELFVLWLQMTRKCVSGLADLKIGCIDDLGFQKTFKIPEKHLFHLRGQYYIRMTDHIYFSRNFKKVIGKYWLEAKFD